MSDFMAAVRHRDGSKNLYCVSEVESFQEARDHLRQVTKAPAVLVCIKGGKGLKVAPIPETEPVQEQSA